MFPDCIWSVIDTQIVKSIKTHSKGGGLTNESPPVADSLSGLKRVDSSSIIHPQNRRPFQMAAPETDEDSYSLDETSAISLVQTEKQKPFR
jgi:hypothetical protein